MKTRINIYQIISFFIFFFLLLCLILWMVWDFLTVIAFSLIITGTFYPLMDLLEKINWKRRNSSLLICALIVLLIFIPTTYMIFHLSKEILKLYNIVFTFFQDDKLQNFFLEKNEFTNFISWIFTSFDLEYSLQKLKTLFLEGLKWVSTRAFNYINTIATNLLGFLFKSFLSILIIYTLLLEGKNLKKYIIEISPMEDEDEKLILNRLYTVNYVTIIYNGIGGLLQGILAGFSFWIVGIESVLSLTFFMMIFAFIPLLGISIIYFPVCIYLLIIGKMYQSLFVFIYCTAVSFIVENWFKPRFMGKKIQVNSLLLLFSMIFGLNFFGLLGLFYGPLIISIFVTVVDLYHQKYKKLLS